MTKIFLAHINAFQKKKGKDIVKVEGSSKEGRGEQREAEAQ